MRYITLVNLNNEFKNVNRFFNRESKSFKDIRNFIETKAKEIVENEIDPNSAVNIEELVKINELLKLTETESNGEESLNFINTLKNKTAKALSTINLEVQASAFITSGKLDKLKTNLSMEKPVFEKRFVGDGYFCFTKSRQKQVIASSLFGTTYAAMNKKDEEEVILSDAGYIAYKRDHNHEFVGYSATIADGFGHGVDDQQQTSIAKAATVAAKLLIKSLNQLSPTDLRPEIIEGILKQIAAKVNQKANRESSCLSGITTFPALEPNKLRICGLNIGDSMVVTWNPENNTWQTLLPAHKLPGGPATITHFKMASECQLLDTTLPRNSVVLLLTDGFYDYLPVNEREIDDMVEITLDVSKMASITTELNSTDPSQITTKIKGFIIEKINTAREQNLLNYNKYNKEYEKLREKVNNGAITSSDYAKELKEIEKELRNAFSLGDDSTILAVTLPEVGTKNPSRQVACEDPAIFSKLGF